MGSYHESVSFSEDPKKKYPISSQAFLTSQISLRIPSIAVDLNEKAPVTSSDLFLKFLEKMMIRELFCNLLTINYIQNLRFCILYVHVLVEYTYYVLTNGLKGCVGGLVWHMAEWVSRAPPHNTLPAFLNRDSTRSTQHLFSTKKWYLLANNNK